MNLNTAKAIAVDIDIDEEKFVSELLSIPEDRWRRQEDPITHDVWKTIWLTKNSKQVFTDFKTAKSIPHSDWSWDFELDIPYIKQIVSSLPITQIGMIRAFVLSGPLVMHVDSDHTTPDDISYKMGLTIAPKLDEPMYLGNTEITDKCLFFDDSVSHGFPTAKKQQISIRIFGKFEYSKFKIVKVYE